MSVAASLSARASSEWRHEPPAVACCGEGPVSVFESCADTGCSSSWEERGRSVSAVQSRCLAGGRGGASWK